MIVPLARNAVLGLLRLRYRIAVRGMEQVAARGTRGILFLANHPALIDPVILMTVLNKTFAAEALADENQIERFLIRYLARKAGVRTIPDVSLSGLASKDQIQQALDLVIGDLQAGRNVLMYPAGLLKHQARELLGGTSAVEQILRRMPDLRVVLIRTTGLWGSGFGWGQGRPSIPRMLKMAAWAIPANFIFFTPRRRVDITLCEPDDIPRGSDRFTINRYLENFYNADAPPNTYVPYTIWRGRTHTIPEPPPQAGAGSASETPDSVRRLVIRHLRELSGKDEIRDQDLLAADLGLDSLARADLMVFIEKEFGFPQGSSDSLVTVADVLLAACGEAASSDQLALPAPNKKWRGATPKRRSLGGVSDRVTIPPGHTITDVFLSQARQNRRRVITADSSGAALTYGQVLSAVAALAPLIRKLPGDCVGIMLPASAGADVVYMATLFAGKIPVLVNWTMGLRNIQHSLDVLDVQAVLTAGALLTRLKAGGLNLADGPLGERFVLLEDLRKSLTFRDKLKAAIVARFAPWSMAANIGRHATQPAAVLFTSGSETLPKAVPLTHANILANIRDIAEAIHIFRSDRMLGMLPPFHSFGLTVTTIVPLLAAVPVVHHPNPTEGPALAQIAHMYRPTLLIGTPTFLGGIVRAAREGQLDSVRLAVTGAEKCPPHLYKQLAHQCRGAAVIEGYGVTECSPVVSFNDPDAPRPGTIGRPLPSIEHAIVEVEPSPGRPTQRVPRGQAGMLLVRGPSIFGGYLKHDGPSPFVSLDGKDWYRTGDLVSEDDRGVLTFVGRLKRFVKLGGEMVSLPAIEDAIQKHYPPDEKNIPQVAVEACGAAHPEITLFTTADIDRQQANAILRDHGLPPLCNIRRVVRLDAIPLLGTGKIDYRTLAATPRV